MIERLWKQYRHEQVPTIIEIEIVDMLQGIFYDGALTAFTAFSEILFDESLTAESRRERLQAIAQEFRSYTQARAARQLANQPAASYKAQ